MTVEIPRALKANSELLAKLGQRIFPGAAPLKTPVPYLVFQGIGSSPEHTIDCGAVNENNAYQLVIWHNDIKEAEAIRLLASTVLEDAGFFYTGKHPDNEDSETKLYGRGWDMSWWSDR